MIRFTGKIIFSLTLALSMIPQALAQSQGDEFIISDNTITDAHAYSEGVFEIDQGRFVSYWKQVDENGHSDGLYAKIYNPNTFMTEIPIEIEENLNLSEVPNSDFFWGVEGAYNPISSTFAFVWVAHYSETSDWTSIYFQSFNLDGEKGLTEARRIHSHSDFIGKPVIEPTYQGGYAVSWIQDMDNNTNTFSTNLKDYLYEVDEIGRNYHWLSSPVEIIGSPLETSDLTANNQNYYVFSNHANQASIYIYPKLYHRGTFHQSGSLFSAGNNKTVKRRSVKAISLENGLTMAIWLVSEPEGTPNLYGQILDANLNLVGGSFQITSDYVTGNASISSINNEQWLVAWNAPDTNQIKRQLFSSNGTFIGPATVLHEYPNNNHFFDGRQDIHIAGRQSGGQIINWTDDIENPFTARGKIVFDEFLIDNTSINTCPLDGWVLIASAIDFLVPLPGAQWDVTNEGNGFSGENYHAADAATPVSFTWNFDIASSGTYSLYASIPGGISTATTTNAKYEIQHANGTTVISADQNNAGELFLGAYQFNGGLEYRIKVAGGDNATGILIADSVRITNE